MARMASLDSIHSHMCGPGSLPEPLPPRQAVQLAVQQAGAICSIVCWATAGFQGGSHTQTTGGILEVFKVGLTREQRVESTRWPSCAQTSRALGHSSCVKKHHSADVFLLGLVLFGMHAP
eukprot:354264-Chlamydomonas_euryale.AAC.3